MKLADYLARERAHNGLTAAEFAVRAGLTPGTISTLKRGLVGASMRTLQNIAIASHGAVRPDTRDWPQLNFGSVKLTRAAE